MTLEIVKARPEHAAVIGENMRAGDWSELLHMGYANGTHAVMSCIVDCPDSVVCLEDGVPIAGWGYKRDSMLLADTALLWCITTPAVERHKRELLRWSRDFCDSLLIHFGRLESTVSRIYPQAVRWTEWLGFVPVSEVTANGVVFTIIEKVRE